MFSVFLPPSTSIRFVHLSIARLINAAMISKIFLVVLLAFSYTNAQSAFTPTPTWGSVSVCIEGKAIYIASGVPNGNNQSGVPQVFSINLTTSWPITAPPYTQLPNSLDGHVYPNILLPDGVTWAAIMNSTYYTYDLGSGTLTKKNPVATYNLKALSAARDPTTGDLVIPSGYVTAQGINATMRFSPTTEALSDLPRFTDVDAHQFYAVVASESAKAIFYFGGLIANDVFATFAKLDYGGSAWTIIAAKGVGPSPRAVTCMVAAYGGTKLVVFGGEGPGKVVLGDIYIYDVATSTWTPGPDAGTSRARAGHVCAVSGDNLVIFGGYINFSRAPVAETTLVFNLKSNTWSDSFVSSGPIPSPPSPGSFGGSGAVSGSGSGSESGPKIGAIAGGVGAVLLVIMGIIFWVRHKKRPRMDEEQQMDMSLLASRTSLNDPQQFSDNTTAESKLAQELLDLESKQYLQLRSPHTNPDSVVSRPEAVARRRGPQVTQERAVDNKQQGFMPTSGPRSPQMLRSPSRENSMHR